MKSVKSIGRVARAMKSRVPRQSISAKVLPLPFLWPVACGPAFAFVFGFPFQSFLRVLRFSFVPFVVRGLVWIWMFTFGFALS